MTTPDADSLTHPMTAAEMLALVRGEDMEQFRKEQELQKALWLESKRYRRLPAERWPPLAFNWDLTPEGQRFALDGEKEQDFRSRYPGGLRLGSVDLLAFDAKLCKLSQRGDPRDVWKHGDDSKLACVIAYLARGLPITPPLVVPVELSKKELFLRGGNHRYAAAKASGQTSLPILVEPEHCEVVSAIVPVQWSDVEPRQ